MKALITLVLASQLAFVAAQAQTTTPPGAAVGSTDPTSASPVNPTPQSATIRILTPASNQKLANTNIVDVRFEIVNPAMSAGTPNFLIQLDGQDPIRTTSMEQTFTGLAPGPHSVTVQMVDANNTPIPGSRAVVQFHVEPQSNTAPAGRTPTPGGLAMTRDTEPLPPADVAKGGPQDPGVQPTAPVTEGSQEPLPSANSLLPLISVIGFGVLVGGIASAMKTR